MEGPTSGACTGNCGAAAGAAGASAGGTGPAAGGTSSATAGAGGANGSDGAAAVVTGTGGDATGSDGDAAAVLVGANAGDEGSKPSAGKAHHSVRVWSVQVLLRMAPARLQNTCAIMSRYRIRLPAPDANHGLTADSVLTLFGHNTWPKHQQRGM